MGKRVEERRKGGKEGESGNEMGKGRKKKWGEGNRIF